jgi:hypothetical protein
MGVICRFSINEMLYSLPGTFRVVIGKVVLNRGQFWEASYFLSIVNQHHIIQVTMGHMVRLILVLRS